MKLPTPKGGDLAEGTRVGRYLVLRDVDGRRHTLAAGAIHAACEQEDGDTVRFLPGGRALRVGVPLATLLSWLTTYPTRRWLRDFLAHRP